jgi:predicted ArsR family transcriptional regulator
MDFDTQVRMVAALGEPVRRELYRFVVAQSAAVSREQAAQGVGVALHVAKFHLDRLEEDGLLDVEYSRATGRGGPGAGRPSKMYRRSDQDIAVSLPTRRYDLAARVMADAITAADATGVPVAEALRQAARSAGRALGDQARISAGSRPARAALIQAISDSLEGEGYEPRSAGPRIELANCPFHSLAETHTDLVCGMNLELLSGLIECLNRTNLRADLDPAPGRCCVTLDAAVHD